MGRKKKPKKKTQRKEELDQQRTEWRKQHRTLNGRLILYPEKQPEHINARGSKTYNWFWNKVLLEIEPQEIPAIISSLKNMINNENDSQKIRVYRTMVGMAEDAYQLKRLEDIKDYDTELLLGKKPVYNSEEGVIYKDGKVFTTDYNDDETRILLRDIEGVIIDAFCSEGKQENMSNERKTSLYKDWDYMEKKKFANI